ncbi:MAG: 50S ribosomal protein L18 [Chlamydiales bacterium]|nr:50S ribosomal protein L18 [Chlamydiia bacterium]MCP5506888.1 50S ribosomal protein L18 [Chlamydiales bacterium]
MNRHLIKTHQKQKKRAMRNRKRLRGSSVRPRLCVVKSNKHIQAQLIDDENGVTLGAVTTYSKDMKGTEFAKKNKTSAARIGTMIGEIAKEKNIKEVVFDRGHHKYHGILAELADAARAAGLKF